MISLTTALAGPLANLLLESWFGEVVVTVGGSLFEQALLQTKEGAEARKARRQVDAMARAVVADLDRFFENESVDPETLDAAAFALGRAIDQADAAFLVDRNLDTKAIEDGLLELDKEWAESMLFGQLARALAPRLREVAPEQPGYKLERDARLLGMAEVVETLPARLARLEVTTERTEKKVDRVSRGVEDLVDRPRKIAEGYEENYLKALVLALNRLDLFGLTVDDPAKGAELEVAYLSLRARLGIGEIGGHITHFRRSGDTLLISAEIGGHITHLREIGGHITHFRRSGDTLLISAGDRGTHYSFPEIGGHITHLRRSGIPGRSGDTLLISGDRGFREIGGHITHLRRSGIPRERSWTPGIE